MAEENIANTLKEVLEQSKQRNFKETVELAVNLKDLDLSNPKNRIDLEIQLPKGRGKDIKVGVFASGELAVKAKNVADIVILPEDIDKLVESKASAKKLVNAHEFFIADASLMPTIGKKLGTVLGPRGKMPKPLPPLADPKTLIANLKSTVRARSKERKTFHVPVGTRDMKIEDLIENINSVIKKLEAKLEKGKMNIRSVYVKTTMGKSVRINII